MIDKAKLEKIKKLADAMYYAAFKLTTDASLLRKAMNDYHQFIINEYHKEEPVSDGLEEAAYHNCIDRLSKESIEDFKAGAQWQKEQMMAKAIDAKLLEGHLIRQKDVTHPLHVGDKVKIIVIKED